MIYDPEILQTRKQTDEDIFSQNCVVNTLFTMGCCASSPHARRRYLRDPGDEDEVTVPLRYFGTNRAGSNLVPDDIEGMSSTHYLDFTSDIHVDELLYDAEIDHGFAYRYLRCLPCFIIFPPVAIWYAGTNGISALLQVCRCDEALCWVRKEYSTRKFFRVYPNRIVINEPQIRCPYGCLGCGSWNSDNVLTHPFDRGAFGFSHVRACTASSLCACWPVYGGTIARHRCQCNGPIWNRACTDCGGWWCDEWLCQLLCCTYRYTGFANTDETVMACAIALQAYFERRPLTKLDMDRCLDFWAHKIAEHTDPVNRKRPVCCEPYIVPCSSCQRCYALVHPSRSIPYGDEQRTSELTEVYKRYNREKDSQILFYKKFVGPVQYSTACRALGCRRFFGRKGCLFCTEGCTGCSRKAGEPAPPFEVHDFDDDWDASSILMKVLGPPPDGVVIRRWRYDPERDANVLVSHPECMSETGGDVSKGV